MYPRTVKVRSSSGTVNEYVRVVEAYREDGKVKQRVVADLGRKDLLARDAPQAPTTLLADEADSSDRSATDLDVGDASTWGPVLVVRALFDQLGLWAILDTALGKAKGVPFADRAFVLVANRLIAPPASTAWPAGSRPTSSATARADASSPTGTNAGGSASIPASSTPGTAPSTSSSPPRTRSKWRCTTASATSSASSPTWCSTTSPAPTSRAPGRTTSPSTATAATASRRTSR